LSLSSHATCQKGRLWGLLADRSTQPQFGLIVDEITDGTWSGLNLTRLQTGSLNPVFKASRPDGTVVAIFKPDSQKFTLKDSLMRTFSIEWDLTRMGRVYEQNFESRREAVTYQLSKSLGFNNVPRSTRGVTDVGTRGTLQQFLRDHVEGDSLKKEAPQKLAAISKEEVERMYLLDAILGAQDRHSRNWMVSESGQIKLIDNDNVLPLQKDLAWKNSTSIHDYFPQAFGSVTKENREAVLALSPDKLDSLLAESNIPNSARTFAILRLESLQSMLKNDVPLENIATSFSTKAAWGYNKDTVVTVIGVGAAVAGGILVGGAFVTGSMEENSASPIEAPKP
jgi:hypothetical protein